MLYLFQITSGRLRYIFGLLARLFNHLQVGTLTDFITLDIARPMVASYAKSRVNKCDLKNTEKAVLKVISNNAPIQVKDIAITLDRKSNQISSILSQLLDYKLVTFRKAGVSRLYEPSVYTQIAFEE